MGLIVLPFKKNIRIRGDFAVIIVLPRFAHRGGVLY